MTTEAIYDFSRSVESLPEPVAVEIARAYLDTIAVTAAGWDHPASRAARSLAPGLGAPWEAGGLEGGPETAALIWGTAAHALDYDDVHMTSVTHPSAVLFPALEVAARLRPETSSRRASAYAVGLAVNVALGNALGFAHYEKGWHATSTLGAVACGAAVAHLFGLDRAAFLSALAIAAAQAGGLQRNFGTMTKPLQAGLAAQAGLRAARLASAGLTGAQDVLGGANGFMAAFGGRPGSELVFDLASAATSLSRKLYPCCYLAHRPAAGALALHRQGVHEAALLPDALIEVEVPTGCLKALTIDLPKNGAEAKFSGKYAVARALKSGRLGLAAFEDEAARDPAVHEIAARVTLRELASRDGNEVGIDRGAVKVTILRKGETVASVAIEAYPGSPSSPASEADLEAKLADCLAYSGLQGEAERIRALALDFAGLSPGIRGS